MVSQIRTISVSRETHRKLMYLKIDLGIRRIDEVIQLLLNFYEKRHQLIKVSILIGKIAQRESRNTNDVIKEFQKRLGIEKALDELTKEELEILSNHLSYRINIFSKN